MKRIIDIPEYDYQYALDYANGKTSTLALNNTDRITKAIANSTPLNECEAEEMNVEEYRQRMIQAFYKAGCSELIALVVQPKEKEFEHLEWLLRSHWNRTEDNKHFGGDNNG